LSSGIFSAWGPVLPLVSSVLIGQTPSVSHLAGKHTFLKAVSIRT